MALVRSTIANLCGSLCLSLVGCGTPDLEPIDTSPVADTDRDTDRDTGSSRYTFDGEVTVRSTVDGAVVCDADAALTGWWPYTGDCLDCDFTFAIAIDDTITRDESTSDCTYYPTLSFIETRDYYDLIMMYTATYFQVYPYERYDDAFMSGWSYRNYIYTTYSYPGPYYTPIAFDGAPHASFTHVGDDLSWSYTYEGTYQAWEYNHYLDCGTIEWSDTTEAFGVPGTGVTTTLDCGDDDLIDVWTFEADGGAVTVTVDTVSEATTFEPILEVNDPGGCTVARAFGNFACTYPPIRGECPSVAIDATVPGPYTVVVSVGNRCPDQPTGEYELRVEGGTDLTLVEDEADQIILVDHLLRFEVRGAGTLTPG